MVCDFTPARASLTYCHHHNQLHQIICNAEEEDSDVAGLAIANSKRRQLEGDQYLFSDTSFQVSPAQGSIWPGMEAEITVTFEPDHAREYKATAYCDVGGRASRLPVQFCGTGLGPKAVFSYDLLDVGEAFINTPHKYEVELLNRCAVGYWSQDELLSDDSGKDRSYAKSCLLSLAELCSEYCLTSCLLLCVWLSHQ